MQTIYDYFRENGEWPTYEMVEKTILSKHPDFDVLEIAQSFMDYAARKYFFHNLRDRAYLSIEQIRNCKGSEKDLADFLKVLRYCIKKFINSDRPGVEVSSEEVGHDLCMDELTLCKIGLLIGDSHIYEYSLSSDEEGSDWNIALINDIIHFNGVRSIDDYLDRYYTYKPNKLKISHLIRSSFVDPSYTIEKIAQTDPSDMKAIGVLSLELSAGYYNEPLKQSQQSFLWARGSTIAGFLFFIAAITLLLFRQPQNIAIICTIGGAISAFIVRTFYVLYQSTSKQALAYKPQVDRAQNFIMASSACESMDEGRKHRVREELVKWFVGLPSITGGDKK